jgi:hypothetical protein
MKIYIIGSLRNKHIPELANFLAAAGFDVFADWFATGPETDKHWQRYETARGRSYTEALYGPHATNVFEFDKRWLDWCDTAVLMLPAGKSAHLELGYVMKTGKRGYILLDDEPERWDVMYRFADRVCNNTEELLMELNK